MSSSSSSTPPARHTASQSLSPSHINTPSPSPLQTATSIPGLPPPSPTTISASEHLQNLLDFTSTLLGLFFVSLFTILFIYWSTLYILRKTLGINFSDGRRDSSASKSPIEKVKKDDNKESKEKKKEVGFAPHPSDREFISTISKSAEIKRRLSGIGETSEPNSPESSHLPQFPSASQLEKEQGEGTSMAGLTDKSPSYKETMAKIAKSSGYEELAKATGRTVEDIQADADLEFQRGVADFGGEGGGGATGKSYGAM